jgi:hypothetical protein
VRQPLPLLVNNGFLWRFKDHPNAKLRQLYIQYDILISSSKFHQIKESETFLGVKHEISELLESVEKHLATQLTDKTRFPVLDESLEIPSDLQTLLYEIFVDPLITDFLINQGRNTFTLTLEKVLDTETEIPKLLEFLDRLSSPKETKKLILKYAETIRGTHTYYDPRQLLRTSCSVGALENPTDEIEGIAPAKNLSEIRRYLRKWANSALSHVKTEVEDRKLDSLKKNIMLSDSNSNWRSDLTPSQPNIQSITKIESIQYTELLFTYVRTNNLPKIQEIMDDNESLNKLRLDYTPNRLNLLQFAKEKSTDTVYRYLLFNIAQKILSERESNSKTFAEHVDETVPDLIYQIFLAAQTEQEKTVICQLSRGYLSYNEIVKYADRYPRSISQSLNVLSGGLIGAIPDKYEWLKQIAKLYIFDFLSFRHETFSQLLQNFLSLGSRFAVLYQPKRLAFCQKASLTPLELSNIIDSPDQSRNSALSSSECSSVVDQGISLESLKRLYDQNLGKFNFLVFNKDVQFGYQLGLWKFRDISRFDLDYLGECIKRETLVLMRVGYSFQEIQTMYINHPQKYAELCSPEVQYLFKIGIERRTVELLQEFAPEKLCMIKIKIQQEGVSNKTFCEIYLDTKRDCFRLNPLSAIQHIVYPFTQPYTQLLQAANGRDASETVANLAV